MNNLPEENDPYAGIATLEKPAPAAAVDPYAGIAKLEPPAPDPYAGIARVEQAAVAPGATAGAIPGKPDPYEGIARIEQPARAGPDPYAGIAVVESPNMVAPVQPAPAAAPAPAKPLLKSDGIIGDVSRSAVSMGGMLAEKGAQIVEGLQDTARSVYELPRTIRDKAFTYLWQAFPDRMKSYQESRARPDRPLEESNLDQTRNKQELVANEFMDGVREIHRDTLKEIHNQGGIPAYVAQQIAEGAGSLAVDLAMLKGISGAQPAELTGSLDRIRQAAMQNAKVSAAVYASTPGTPEEKLESAVHTAGVMGMPTVASQLTKTWMAKTAAVLGLAGLNTRSYREGLQAAHEEAVRAGRPEDWPKYAVSTIGVQAMTDLMFGILTRSNPFYSKAERAEAQEFANKLKGEWEASVGADQKAELLRQKDLARRALGGDKAAQAELAQARGISVTPEPAAPAPEARRAEGLLPEQSAAAQAAAMSRGEIPLAPALSPALQPVASPGSTAQQPVAPGSIGQQPAAPAIVPEVPKGPAPIVAPAAAAEVEKAPGAQAQLVDVPVYQVPINAIALRPDIMQFKRMEDTVKGINKLDKIEGQWDDYKAGNVLLWEPLDPAKYNLDPGQKYIIANGHHRFEFAERAGRTGLNAQIIREADGYTERDARQYGAELNIADGKGTIYDAVKWTRDFAATFGADQAAIAGRRIGVKGRKAATIATASGDNLYNAFINEAISPDQAEIIAPAAPNDEPLQQIGIKQALQGKSGPALSNFLQAVSAVNREAKGAIQIDMFGQDDPAIKAMEAQAARATVFQKIIQDHVTAVQSAAKRPEQAKRLGIDVKDPEAIRAAVERLKIQAERWQEWALNTDLVDIVAGRNPIAPEDYIQNLLSAAPAALTPEQLAAHQANLLAKAAEYDKQHPLPSALPDVTPEGYGPGSAAAAPPGKPKSELDSAREDLDAEMVRSDVAGYGDKASPGKSWPQAFPRVIPMTSQVWMKNNPDYKAAKSGDLTAALQLAVKVVKADKIQNLARQYPDAVVVAVHGEEAAGRNKIPQALAEVIGNMAGWTVDDEIIQKNKVFHTGTGADHRMAIRPKFDGAVLAGRNYILVDDTVTMGSTLAECRRFIEEGGGNVVGMVTMGHAQFSTVIAMQPKTILDLEAKYGKSRLNEWCKENGLYGGEYRALTEAEARWLLRAPGLDAARDRIVAARQKAGAQGERGDPGPDESAKVKSIQADYAGNLKQGAGFPEIKPQGPTAFRFLLQNVAGSKTQAQAQFNTDLLAGQEIQRKAIALIDAITAGRIKEPEARARWDKFIDQVTRSKAKLDQAAGKLKAGPEQRGLFSIDNPKESGMLLDKRADYKPEQQEFNYDYQQRPGEDKKANAEQAIKALEEIGRVYNTGPVKSGSIRESKEEIQRGSDSAHSPSSTLRRGQKVILDIVGRGITYNLSKTAHTPLIGQRVDSTAGIHELVKTARNARLETFRFLIIKDGLVVFDLPYASRLPGCVLLPKTPSKMTDAVKLLAQEYGAESVSYHNHPSALTKMSDADLSVRAEYVRELGPQYKGNMVGNHGEYSFIGPDGIPRTVISEEIKIQPDKLRTPDIPHPALGKEIRSPGDVWDIIKQYRSGADQNKIMLIGISGGAGSGGGIVQGIAEVDREILNTPPRAWALIRSFARNTGTVNVVASGISKAEFKQYRYLLEQAVKKGVIRDVILDDGTSLKDSGVKRTDRMEGSTFGMPAAIGRRLADTAAPYGNEKEFALIQKAAKVLGAWARANPSALLRAGGIPQITPEIYRAVLGDKAEKLAGMQAAIIETCNAQMKGIQGGNVTESRGIGVPASGPQPAAEPVSAEAAPPGAPPAIEVPPAPEMTAQERIEKSGMFGIGEDYGKPASNLPPADDPGYSMFPIEMPELVQMVRELTGKFPRTKRHMRMLGYFSPRGNESEITIKANTFDLVTSYEKSEILQKVAENILGQPGEMGGPDPKTAKQLIKEEYERQVDELRQARTGKPAWWAASVMAHEIGHAADWDPLKVIRGRGNIFAHIASLSDFMKKSFPMKPGDDEGLAPEIRKELRAQAQKEARAALGKKPDEKELLAKIKEIYAKKVEDALESEGLVRYSDVVSELRDMIAWWHGTERIPDYFNNTPHEMYAETLSVLLNNPAAVQKRAPNFYRMFYAYMERKPAFRAAYEKVMDDIKTSSTYENRDRIMTEDMKQSAKDLQDWADKMNERTWREWKDITRRQVDRELGPLEQRIVKIADKDLMGEALGSMERYLYRAPMQNGALLRMENEVMKPLFKSGLEIIDFDKYLFHLRVLLDRPAAGDIARPWGYDRKSSGEMLAEMRKRSGQAFETMEELQKKFRAVYKEEALDRLRHYNIYGEDMMADLDARDAYATFQVNRLGTPPEDTLKAMFESRFGSGITSHIFKQYGTLYPVASPYTATVQKMMRLISMAERENMKFNVLQGLMSDGSPFKNEWQPAEKVFNKGDKRMEIRVIDNDKVGTVTVLHDGKLTGYYGPRVLVDALMFARTDEVQMWMKVAFAAFNIQKGILTRFNPTFVLRNVYRDVRTYNLLMPGTSRDWMNWVPGLPGGAWSRYAYPAFKAAVSIYRGAPNTIGQDALRRGFVGQQGVYYGGNAMAGAEQKLQSFGHAPEKQSLIKFVGQVVRDVVAAAGPVSESMTKINGMIRMDRRSNEPEWKKLIAAHTWAGSPNFWQKGAGARMLELVRMFFNPWKEGMRSTSWAFFGGGGWEARPWESALNFIRRTLIPRLGLFMLVGGGIGLLLKKRFDEMPDGVQQYQDGPSDFDRRNSHCLPLGWYDRAEHKVMYLTLPLSESERIFSAAFDVLLRSTVGDLSEAPKLHMMSDFMAYTAGQLPGINPVVGAIGDWGNYMTGGNPYDEYRQRFALNENQAQVRGIEGLKAMGIYSINKLFGSLTGPLFEQPRVDELPKTKWEKILSHTPGLRGYVKISNNGYRERMRNSTIPVLDQQAQIRIEEEKMVLRLRKGGKLTQDEFMQLIEGAALDDKLKNIPIPLAPDMELKRYRWTHFMTLMDKAGIAYAPPEIRNYMRQPTRALKSAVLQEMMK
jgi:hypothetical protein